MQLAPIATTNMAHGVVSSFLQTVNSGCIGASISSPLLSAVASRGRTDVRVGSSRANAATESVVAFETVKASCPCCQGRCERDALEILRGGGANALSESSRVSVVCIGDSITAGVGSSEVGTGYPAQLQRLLGDKYIVTNLGACCAAMQQTADTPYWQRLQWQAAQRVRADVVIIMLGTNDARPPNWQGANGACQYEADCKVMMDALQRDGARPTFFLAVPPPFYGSAPQPGPWNAALVATNAMVQAVVNDILPGLVPKIAERLGLVTKPIPVFEALGGRALSQNSLFPDGVHPNDLGYLQLALTVHSVLGPTLNAQSGKAQTNSKHAWRSKREYFGKTVPILADPAIKFQSSAKASTASVGVVAPPGLLAPVAVTPAFAWGSAKASPFSSPVCSPLRSSNFFVHPSLASSSSAMIPPARPVVARHRSRSNALRTRPRAHSRSLSPVRHNMGSHTANAMFCVAPVPWVAAR